jgi:hypothetical protein
MLSKTQFKEWFDRYKYADYRLQLHYCLQLSRIFSGLTTALLDYIFEYFAFFYSVIIGMYWQSAKKRTAIQQKTNFKTCFDNQNLLLSLAILRY